MLKCLLKSRTVYSRILISDGHREMYMTFLACCRLDPDFELYFQAPPGQFEERTVNRRTSRKEIF